METKQAIQELDRLRVKMLNIFLSVAKVDDPLIDWYLDANDHHQVILSEMAKKGKINIDPLKEKDFDPNEGREC